MFGKSLIAVILLTSLIACDNQNVTSKEKSVENSPNSSSTFASDAEKVIKDNVESIEDNYKQQSYDSAPAEKVD